MDYIIVQAGGRGSRLEHLTRNKPKALVPVENLPMLFHLFRKYKDKRFIVIADYKKEVMRKYLSCFSEVKYQVVDADGTGTCAGIKKAVDLIPDNEEFMLVWSDLILPKDFQLPDLKANYIGISKTFPCRWSYYDNQFQEERSSDYGVAGLFVFRNRTFLYDVPENGEFVRYLQAKQMIFAELSLAGTKEFGILDEYNQLETDKCRPFNKITINEDIVIKEGIDSQGTELAAKEYRWYEKAKVKAYNAIPEIYEFSPLKMERIKGKNIYEYDFIYEKKKEILHKLVTALKELHNTERAPADSFSLKEAYYTKTIKRLDKVRDLIPFSDERIITVNGRKCRNIYYHKRELEKHLDKIRCKKFSFIHGDCTFSNVLLRENKTPVFIDPRGYFGFTELYGDPLYDWAKLFYSIVGNYDQFNLKRFHLEINESDVDLSICSNHWEDMELEFYTLTGVKPEDIKLIHAVIWLSLTTYAWNDYDSVCGAFYNGLYYLEEVL